MAFNFSLFVSAFSHFVLKICSVLYFLPPVLVIQLNSCGYLTIQVSHATKSQTFLPCQPLILSFVKLKFHTLIRPSKRSLTSIVCLFFYLLVNKISFHSILSFTNFSFSSKPIFSILVSSILLCFFYLSQWFLYM